MDKHGTVYCSCCTSCTVQLVVEGALGWNAAAQCVLDKIIRKSACCTFIASILVYCKLFCKQSVQAVKCPAPVWGCMFSLYITEVKDFVSICEHSAFPADAHSHSTRSAALQNRLGNARFSMTFSVHTLQQQLRASECLYVDTVTLHKREPLTNHQPMATWPSCRQSCRQSCRHVSVH